MPEPKQTSEGKAACFPADMVPVHTVKFCMDTQTFPEHSIVQDTKHHKGRRYSNNSQTQNGVGVAILLQGENVYIPEMHLGLIPRTSSNESNAMTILLISIFQIWYSCRPLICSL